MPIKDKSLYPPDWKEIRKRILARAGNHCEGSPMFPDCRAENSQRHTYTGSKVVLTIAHMDHGLTNHSDANLKALCQRCHLTHDRKFNMRVSSTAAAAATNNSNGNNHKGNSPALDQLKAAIEPDAGSEVSSGNDSAATAVLEQPLPDLPTFHRITVPMPAECQTKITLLFLCGLDPDSLGSIHLSETWSTGFHVAQDFDGGQSIKVEPDATDDIASSSPTYETLAEAVQAAAANVETWLDGEMNSQETGATIIALREWWRKFAEPADGEDEVVLDDSIFDGPEDGESIIQEGNTSNENQASHENLQTIAPSAAASLEKIDTRSGMGPAVEVPQAADIKPGMVSGPNTSISAALKAEYDKTDARFNAAIASRQPYDPIAEIEEEISEIGERIVQHSCKISELDAALKAEKKSWKTASDELVAKYQYKTELIVERNDKEQREAVAKVVTAETPVRPRVEVQSNSTPTVATASAIAADVSCTAPESTTDHAARMAEVFAPDPNAAPTTGQPADDSWKAVRLDSLPGLTPKILEILTGNNIVTMGDFAAVPAMKGIEYTQLSHNGAKLTEARLVKIQDAMGEYWKKNPATVTAVSEVSAVDIDDI